ncbi:hypothetical protein [Pseudomonas aeruginosa]|uniref:hypothetical protein n=1 Tax=Pseudomonas aeruginosa TaxID=287 RepID=UPI0015F09E8F|nr:hypothetical protein [Pseudomonas aeruginosa]MBA5110406.1 hypothetical protein [Pseudomonas aeruginosa]
MGDPLHRTSQGERSMLGKAEKLSVLVVFELRLIIWILFSIERLKPPAFSR